MWLALVLLVSQAVGADILDTTCRWTDLTWSHAGVELRLPGTSTSFARLHYGAVIDGRLGALGDEVRLRLSTKGPVQVTGDMHSEHEVFHLSHGPLDLGPGVVLATGHTLTPIGVDGDGVTVRPDLPPPYHSFTTPLQGTAACKQLNLLPRPGLFGEAALKEAGHTHGEKRQAEGPLEYHDAEGRLLTRLTGAYTQRMWLQETRDTRARVAVEVNGVVWTAWVEADRLTEVSTVRGSGLGGGGSASGVLPGEVPMKTVRDARCPEARPLWFVGPDGAVEVGTVTPEQVLRHDEASDGRAPVKLVKARVEPLGGHFEVDLKGCAVEETQVPR